MKVSNRVAVTRSVFAQTKYLLNDQRMRDLWRCVVGMLELCSDARMQVTGREKHQSPCSHFEYLGRGVEAPEDVQCSPCSEMHVNKMPS
jgi:hypothetical protein